MTLIRTQRHILLHGLIVFLAGLLCGVPFGRAVTHGWGDEAVRAWRLAHFSLVVGGVWLMAVAASSSLLVLSHRGMALLRYSAVTAGYGFTVALVVSAIAGVRGLEPAGPLPNIVAFCANISASAASLVWVVVSIVGVVRALRQDERGVGS